MMKSPVNGHPGLYKDTETNVIVNRAQTDRERYRIAKQQALSSKNTETELAELRGEIDEIKSLLQQLINK
tara:strand:- start:454 stop:663 length:210 start_codon:yes stop_codon:yes gene_type:complete